jgi:prophage regulatory protein
MDQQAPNVAVERRASSSRPGVQFIRLKEVLAICGRSRSSIYEAIKKRKFPETGEAARQVVGLDQM